MVATNAHGSSDSFVSTRNSLVVIDPNQRDIDSDGDKFPDGLEVLLGSSPADPQSVPYPDALIPEFTGPIFSVVNTADPSQSAPMTEVVGSVFSIVNTTDPSQSAPETEVVGLLFSIVNTIDLRQSAPIMEEVSPVFSVQNQP